MELKNLYKCINYLIFLTLLIFLSNCGYVSDSPPKNLDLYKATELNPCKIDATKLAEIFKEDQKEQIKCLEENFLQFTKYVKSNENGQISELELNQFVTKFFDKQSENLVSGLGLIFQINMLLLKDEAKKISHNNIAPLFQLLLNVNQDAIVITDILKSMATEANSKNFWEKREALKVIIEKFASDTLLIISKSNGNNQELDIKKFIFDITKRLDNKVITEENINNILLLKKLMISGEKNIITSEEIKNLINKIPKLIALSFDFYYSKNEYFTSEEEKANFNLKNINELASLINFKQENFNILTSEELLNLLEKYFDGKNFLRFKSSYESLKLKLLGGEKNQFDLQDFKSLYNLAQEFFERNYFNRKSYSLLRPELEKNENINYPIQIPDQNFNTEISTEKLSKYIKHFQSILINYRYFRDINSGVSFYGNNIKRNESGFIEISNLNWLCDKLIQSYGHINQKNKWQITLEEFQKLLYELKPLLEEFNLWSPYPETFARNAILLADLFQNQSNGDSEVDLIEATEYLQMILSAVDISNKFSKELVKDCKNQSNFKDASFETECFNLHFFETFLEKLQLKKFFPRLNSYVLNSPSTELMSYLVGVEGFARDRPLPNVPVSKRDSILTLGAILNIESTFIRFDDNRDNVISYEELIKAFRVYKSAVISLAKLEDETYAQSIFLYMVLKMEIPPSGGVINNSKFYLFHKCISSDLCRKATYGTIEAKRLNIGKLLFYLVNQSSSSEAKKRFRNQ